MARLCIHSRDELRIIDLDEVAYLSASGSYTDFHYQDGQVRSEAQCLSFFEDCIRQQLGRAAQGFFRLSRSYLIHTDMVYSLNVQQDLLRLGHAGQLSLHLTKPLLRKLKAHIVSQYAAPVTL